MYIGWADRVAFMPDNFRSAGSWLGVMPMQAPMIYFGRKFMAQRNIGNTIFIEQHQCDLNLNNDQLTRSGLGLSAPT